MINQLINLYKILKGEIKLAEATVNVIPKTVPAAIKYAIKNKKYLEFNYNNKWTNAAGERFVIPACLGRLKSSGRMVLRGYLLAGVSFSISQGVTSSKWKLYLLNRINFFKVSENGFYLRPSGYKLNDKSMSTIDAQLEFEEEIDENDIEWFDN